VTSEGLTAYEGGRAREASILPSATTLIKPTGFFNSFFKEKRVLYFLKCLPSFASKY
jgi:hypothetical protein